MRQRTCNQTGIEFQAAPLPETVAYYSRYETIDETLRDNPGVVKLVHQDIKSLLSASLGAVFS